MGGSVLKSYVKTLAIVAGLGWASAACAVGFGEPDVKSALGQPLKIEIALTSVSESDRNGMTAHMASPEAFKSAKLEYPYNLAKLKFDIAVRGRQTYILVTSKEPVNDIAHQPPGGTELVVRPADARIHFPARPARLQARSTQGGRSYPDTAGDSDCAARGSGSSAHSGRCFHPRPD